jgi:hypothetical protein
MDALELAELDHSFGEREESKVSTKVGVETGVILSASLSGNDLADFDGLTAIKLDTKPFTGAL